MTYFKIHSFLKTSIIVLSLLIGVKSFAVEVGEPDPSKSCQVYTGTTGVQSSVYYDVTVSSNYCNSKVGIEIIDSQGRYFTPTSLSSYYQTRCTFNGTIPVYSDPPTCPDGVALDPLTCNCIDPCTASDPDSYTLPDSTCGCYEGYEKQDGFCVPCYDLVQTSNYYERSYSNIQPTSCYMHPDLTGLTEIDEYISSVKYVSCLGSCIVGYTVCPTGEEVNSLRDGCNASTPPDSDSTCSNWIKTGYLDLSGDAGQVTFDRGYPENVTPPYCYNVYDCNDDMTLKKYSQTSCGFTSSDDPTTSDPNDPSNQDDPTHDDSSSDFDSNATTQLPTLDLNSSSSVSNSQLASLAKISDTLFTVDESLKTGFSDMKDQLSTTNDTLTSLDGSMSDLNTKLDISNDHLGDISSKIDTTNSKLDNIADKLTDPLDQDDYDGFVDSTASNAFSTFSGRGVLPFSGVVNAVPTVSFSMHGKTFSLLDSNMLASVDWSLFRSFLLFLASISAFHRIFTNV